MRAGKVRGALFGLALWGLNSPVEAQTITPALSGEMPPAPLPPRGKPLQWQPGWKKFSPLDYGVSLASGAVAIGALLFGPGRDRAIDRQLGIDDTIRDHLRAPTDRGRLWARDASDVALALLVSYPIAVDGLLNAGWYRRSPEVAMQMILMDLEVQAINGGITSLFKAFVLRERPYGRACGEEISEQTNDCRRKDRYFSHFSGHASASFASASVLCMHHQQHSLLEQTSAWLPCGTAYAAATATATLRVIADRHYASDVLAGAITGTLTGLLVPWLHYRRNGQQSDSADSATWLAAHHIGLVPAARSLQVVGVF